MIESLAQKFIDDSESLSEQELTTLLDALKGDAEFATALKDHLVTDQLLSCVLDGTRRDFPGQISQRLHDEGKSTQIANNTVSAIVRKPKASSRTSGRTAGRVSRRHRSHPIRWGTWISVAACLAIIVGAHLVNLRQVDRMTDVMMAKLAQMDGNVRVERNGKNITVFLEMDLFPNDVVRTGRRGRATVEYKNEATTVDLLSGTKARFWSERGAKRIDVPAGTVECDIASQPKGRELVVITPQAKAEIRGTRFSLAVANNATRIEVTKGLVRFSRLSDGVWVDVAAGQYAVAAEGVALAALALQQTGPGTYAAPDTPIDGKGTPMVAEPGPSGYTLGSIIFEDDFDKGMDNWELVIGKDVRSLKPAGAEAEAIIDLQPAKSSYKRFEEVLDGHSNQGIVNLNFYKAEAQGLIGCLRTKAPITEEAFSVKLFVPGLADGWYMTPFPWGRVLSVQRHQLRGMFPARAYMRWDCVPAGRDEDGTPLLEIRRYLKDLKYEPGMKVEGLLDTSIISCADRRIGIACGSATLRVLRVEVRSLVKE